MDLNTVSFILTVLLLLSHRVTPHPSPGATPWCPKAVAAPPCPCAGLAKTPPPYLAGRRATRAHRSTPARDPCCQTTSWMPERYNTPKTHSLTCRCSQEKEAVCWKVDSNHWLSCSLHVNYNRILLWAVFKIMGKKREWSRWVRETTY